MPFQYILYLKVDRSEENVFLYSHIFIIFEVLILYLEHKRRLQKRYSHIALSI